MFIRTAGDAESMVFSPRESARRPIATPPAIGRRPISSERTGRSWVLSRSVDYEAVFYRAALRSAVGGIWYGVVSTAPDFGEIVRNK